MAIEDEQLLTVREVARRCNRSEETVRRWIWSGKLPARKLGNQLFVEPGDVDQGAIRLDIPRVKWSLDELKAQQKREKKLRDRVFKRHGYFDTAALVRESHEGH